MFIENCLTRLGLRRRWTDTCSRTNAPPTLGKGGNVASAGWQLTLCDPMWHVSFRSGVATSRTVIHLLLTYLFTYLLAPDNSEASTIRTHCKAVKLTLPTVILIIIGIPSPTNSFISGLKTSFSANPSHCSLSFFFRTYYVYSPYCVLLLLSISVFTF